MSTAESNTLLRTMTEVLNDLEDQFRSGTPVEEGIFRSLTAMLYMADHGHDDEALSEGLERLKRLYDPRHDPKQANDYGRLLGHIDWAAYALQHMTSKVTLEQVAPGTLRRRFLELLAAEMTLEREQIQSALGISSDEVKKLLEWGRPLGLIVFRWKYCEITPRGREALHLTRP